MRMNLGQWRARTGGLHHRPARKQKVAPTRRPLTRYKATVGKRTLTVKALTKSEARAAMKKKLGLDRLPPGTRLVEA